MSPGWEGTEPGHSALCHSSQKGALSQCCQQCGHLLQCQGPDHSGDNLPQETCDHVLLALGPIRSLHLELAIL